MKTNYLLNNYPIKSGSQWITLTIASGTISLKLNVKN